MEQEGRDAGIGATPTFFLDGVKTTFDLQPDSPTVQSIPAANLLAELKRVTGR
jgi:protein-disulfide isomerase